MIVGSLFSGIGGFDLGLQRAGFRTAWFCEQDEFCQRVLAKHWPGVPCYGDIRALTAELVRPVDMLCGGFPCQDVSLTGKGAGLDGARSGLWSEYARLIGELRPRYVIVENVPGLRSRGLGRVLGEMAALGYDAEWDCIPASALGAPHRRDRIWIVAYPAGSGRWPGLREVGARQETGSFNEPESRDSSGAFRAGLMANSDGLGRSQGLQLATGTEQRPGTRDAERPGSREGSGAWPIEPAVRRVVDGLPDRLDRCHALGNALVPQIAEWIGGRVMQYESELNVSRIATHGGEELDGLGTLRVAVPASGLVPGVDDVAEREAGNVGLRRANRDGADGVHALEPTAEAFAGFNEERN